MTDAVKNQEAGAPDQNQKEKELGKAELNFRRLEAAKDAEKEARIRAEMQVESLRNEMSEIRQMMQPKESDPLDGVEDYVDASSLRAKLEKEKVLLKKEAKAIAKQTYEEERAADNKKNYLQRLKTEYRDYDDVMTQANIEQLEQQDPVFIRAVLRNTDDYERRLDTYERIKVMKTAPKQQEAPSIKEKVAENQQNSFYIPSTTATPTAVDFDTRSKTSREAAYAKLKQAQRRPLGSGSSPQ